MDAISQLLQSTVPMQLDAGFLCNLLAFTVVLESLSVVVGHIANVGR